MHRIIKRTLCKRSGGAPLWVGKRAKNAERSPLNGHSLLFPTGVLAFYLKDFIYNYTVCLSPHNFVFYKLVAKFSAEPKYNAVIFGLSVKQ
jgi:hypothetical protein